MPARRDPHAVRFGHVEEVADAEPADRSALDPLDRDADVVEAHVRHARTLAVADRDTRRMVLALVQQRVHSCG